MPLNLGSSDDDAASALAVDGAGNAYVAGLRTRPTSRAAPALSSRRTPTPALFTIAVFFTFGNVLIAKLSADGTRLLFSTLVGGSSDEAPSAIAMDDSGNAT